MTSAAHPRRLDEALRRMAEDPGCIPIAGCTDWMVGRSTLLEPTPSLLDLSRVEELRGIEGEGEGLRIGAAATFAEIQHHDALRERYPILVDAASQIGGKQIQNRATLGGNVVNASPAGDSLPVLLALGAEVEVASAQASRRIPYDDFHTGYRQTALEPGELLISIHLPAPATFQRFRKVGTRRAQAISKVVLALCAEREGDRWSQVRIGAGSVAPTPCRLRDAEAALEGRAVEAASAELAAQAAQAEVHPIDDVRSTAHYRRWVLGRVLRRMLLG
jgi:CO/xanthine dehydrogenase FAD-binding subunit